ncbi:MAG: hypothetical protein LEGION0398_MBIBDBAK_01087 [Legionellaceae bacterium]
MDKYKVYIFSKLIFIVSVFFSTTNSYAWENHSILTYLSLKNFPVVKNSPEVIVESLEDFLKAENHGLVKLLKDNELWFKKNIPYYPILPKEIEFKISNNPVSLRKRFIESIRINSFYPFILYKENFFNKQIDKKRTININKIAFYHSPMVKNKSFSLISPGDKISALEIISSASDEPDFGLDMGIWEDSETAQGKLYKLGKQPFGNPKIGVSRQVPFHVGFYHESKIIYFLAGFLKKCYPEYRFYQYLQLSKYAFSTGHPYWGWRFLGWALHYVQDLTQPFHVKATPGFSDSEDIKSYILNFSCFDKSLNKIKKTVFNQHMLIENYIFNGINFLIKHNHKKHAFIKKLSDTTKDKEYPNFNGRYLRDIVSYYTFIHSDAYAKAINQAFPEKYIFNGNYTFGETTPDIDILNITSPGFLYRNNKLNKLSENLLSMFGIYTRKIVYYVISTEKK